MRVIGATLWTDFRLNSIAHEAAAHKVALGMANFTGAIQHERKRFTTYESTRSHAAERAFIEDELASTRKIGHSAVVVTHRAPTPRSIAPHFEGHPCNPGLASDLDDLIERYQPARSGFTAACTTRSRPGCSATRQGTTPRRTRNGTNAPTLCVEST